MKYYKDANNHVFAYAADNSQDHLILNKVLMTQAEVDALSIIVPPTALAITIAEIQTLEASITQRRLREALLGVDNGWLAGIDAQIVVLRASLV